MMFDTVLYGTPEREITHRHKLAGAVKVNGVGAIRRVCVFERGSFNYVSSTVSNDDGGWEILNIPEYPPESLIVLTFDDVNKEFNAEVADFISQVATV